MTIEFPAPAASEQPGSPAPQTSFPVYDPRDMPPPATVSSQAIPDDKRGTLPGTPKTDNPLGDYHKTAQAEPGNERELLFTIGGVPLYAPREEDIDPGIGIRLIRDMRKFGVPYAVANAIGEMLGDAALDLLADAPRMSKEEWAQIMGVLQDKVFSRMQENMPGGKG